MGVGVGVKALLQLANFTLGPDASLNTRTHNLCFEQKYEKYQNFLSEIFFFFFFFFYCCKMNRHVFVMEELQ